MKKSFQLSAVAIAIAASSSVMAATVAQTGASFETSASVNGINVNGTLTGPAIPGTSKTDNPFNVQFTGAVTINPGDSDSAILTSIFGSQPVPAGAAVTHNADGTKTITYQVANNTIQTDTSNVNTSTQIINDQKVELSNGISTTKTQRDFSGQTVTLQYTPNGVGNNFVGSNPVPVAPVVTNLPSTPLLVDSITVGKKVAGADNALTVTRIDVDATGTTTTTESVVKASGITTSHINGNGTNGSLVLSGGTGTTTQTLDDNGVSFVTTQPGTGIVTATTTIDANGNLVVKGRDVLADIDAEAATRAAADTTLQNNIDAEAATRAADDTTLQNNIDAEAATRAADDTTLQNNIDAEAATRAADDTTLQNNIDAEAATRAADDTTLQNNIDAEAATRAAGDNAIRTEIATKVTTNELEVNGPSNFNGPVTVNNVQSSVVNAQPTVAGKDIVVPTVNQNWANTTQTITSDRVDSQEQTRNETKQVYNKDLLQFSSAIVEGTLETTTSQTATATYDANGVIVPGSLQGPALGQPTQEFKEKSTSSIQEIALGRKDIQDDLGLSITKTAAGVTNTSSLTAAGISTTGSVTAKAVIVDGKNVADEFTRVDAAAAAEKTRVNGELAAATTDRAAIRTEFAAADTAIRSEAAIEKTRVNGEFAAATTDRAAIRTEFAAADTAIRSEAATEKTRVNGELAAATTDRAAIRTEFAAADTAIRSEAATEKTRVNGEFTRVDTAAAAETVRVNTALTTEATARSAGDAATLTAANNYTNVRANQLNSRIDDVQQTAYRGVAIALAAQQQVPNIKPGQFAVFGGVGHYESESAVALGVVGALNDRLSMSAALGFADGSEIGGRVGVAYVFGGK